MLICLQPSQRVWQLVQKQSGWVAFLAPCRTEYNKKGEKILWECQRQSKMRENTGFQLKSYMPSCRNALLPMFSSWVSVRFHAEGSQGSLTMVCHSGEAVLWGHESSDEMEMNSKQSAAPLKYHRSRALELKGFFFLAVLFYTFPEKSS